MWFKGKLSRTSYPWIQPHCHPTNTKPSFGIPLIPGLEKPVINGGEPLVEYTVNRVPWPGVRKEQWTNLGQWAGIHSSKSDVSGSSIPTRWQHHEKPWTQRCQLGFGGYRAKMEPEVGKPQLLVWLHGKEGCQVLRRKGIAGASSRDECRGRNNRSKPQHCDVTDRKGTLLGEGRATKRGMFVYWLYCVRPSAFHMFLKHKGAKQLYSYASSAIY